MSKELVISSTRHETKVAILEDDQVVEVYHQREKEYSLAGSIHKGRVTRVLPGMQSSFVDIGLERDAFLYVSDFFEDNEEYDKIVSSVEDNVLRLERGVQAPSVAPSAVATSETPKVPEAPAVEAAPATPPASAEPGPSGGRFEDRDARERRGRRPRRRRQKGRGLPESKYFSPSARPEVTTPAPDTGESEPEEDDFFVLPGESLAKHTRPETSSAVSGEGSVDPEPATEPAEVSPVSRFESFSPPEPAEALAESLAGPEPVEPNDASPTEPPSDEPAEEPLARIDSEEEAAQSFEGAENIEPVYTDSADQEEKPEPARIPTSLTATLREQGPRYLHRISRRMRRKARQEERRLGEAARPQEPKTERVAPRPDTGRPGSPSITDLLREGQEIIVQIAKEPLGQKGARITSHIALPGRFLVYMPTVDHIGVSRKIASDEERARLKRILQAHRAGIPGGYIVRTAGEGRTEEELRADLMFLYNLWLDLRQKAEKRPAPALIHHDLGVVERILRDQLTSAFKSIWVDNEEVYENVLSFVQRFQPALVGRVRLYTRSNPIFDELNITPELEKALRPKVWLKSGGYIVINQTEALVAIDVNTGKFVGKSNRLEDTIVKTNTDAIKEIVRQIRLRDLGGIIVVDFIDMDERKNRQKVMQVLEEAMRLDRAPYKILQFNDFGLVAITRKRVKQSLERTLCSPCPNCDGAGYVKSVQTVIGEILQEARKLSRAVQGQDVMLRVHPDVAKILKSNQNDYLQELEETLGRTVIVKSDPLLHQEKFDLA